MIDNDSDCLYLSLAARSLNPEIFIIARANNEKAKKRILRAGANKVILPIVMSGMKVAESILNPSVEDYVDLTGVNFSKEDRIRLADMTVCPNSSLIGHTLLEKGPEMDNLIIVGIKKNDNDFIFKPQAEYTFQAGDCLISMGTKESYESALSKFGLS